MKISIKSKIKGFCPELSLGILQCKIRNSGTSDALKQILQTEIEVIQNDYTIPELAKRPAIAATRTMYKRLGKDTNRYRPSSEALSRRILKDLPIYYINTVVDCINIVSIRTGYSIGGFDAEKIFGDLELRIGLATDEFDAIGRGMLNVENLPLFCDSIGGIGTPTSDNERTKIIEDTTHLLVIINAYDGDLGLNVAINQMVELLEKFAEVKDIKVDLIH